MGTKDEADASIRRKTNICVPSSVLGPSSPTSLTERERQVLRLIAQNLPNQEIADRLFISVNTVKTHVKRIYAKLDVHDRFQAASRAAELGLLPPDPH